MNNELLLSLSLSLSPPLPPLFPSNFSLPLPLLRRAAEPRVVVELRHQLLELVAGLALRQDRGREHVLLLDKGLGLLAVRVLEPAVRVGDFFAVERLHDRGVPADGRVGGGRDGEGALRGAGRCCLVVVFFFFFFF